MDYIGKRLGDPAIPTPAAVLDRAAVQRNCARMLAAVQAMRLGWRAHIKTHKTIELTRLQVGDKLPVRIIVSTLLEAERVLPLLEEYQRAKTRTVNVLYGFPLYVSAVPRLAAVARKLGPGGVSVLVDHPDQVDVVLQLARAAGSGTTINVYAKVDMGSSRAGVVLGSKQCTALLRRLLAEQSDGLAFYGLYCHAGHSYDAREPWAAMEHLVSEFTALGAVAEEVERLRPEAAAVAAGHAPQPLPLVLSVGASPTAATLQHPGLAGGDEETGAKDSNVRALRAALHGLEAKGYELEVHAGVQPVLDLQQLATHSWAPEPGHSVADDLALTVLADVASIYPGRGGQGADEILVNVGCLALGREAVKNVPVAGGAPTYSGWGIVRPWEGIDDGRAGVPGDGFPQLPSTDDGAKGWWQVDRISQEHGILAWTGPSVAPTPQLGQRLRIWPNHACIAGAGFSHYLVVDSTSSEPDKVVDVWERWNGW